MLKLDGMCPLLRSDPDECTLCFMRMAVENGT